MHSHNPVWSPDGRWIYFVHGVDVTEKMDIWRIQPSGEAPERLTDQNAAVNFLAPLDARTLIYTARAEDGTGPALWTLDVPSTDHAQGKFRSRALHFRGGQSRWQAHRGDRRQPERQPVARAAGRSARRRSRRATVPVSAVRALAPRFAGASLYYLATGGVGDSLWRLSDGQASEVVRGADMPLSEPAAVSPDGQRIVVVVEARRVAAAGHHVGGRHERANAGALDRRYKALRVRPLPTGRPMAPGSWQAASTPMGPALFKIPANGGDPVRIVSGKAVNPVWSPRREPDCVRRATRRRPDAARVGATGRHGRRSATHPRASRRLSLPAR